jgi:hypothetical protein
MSTALSSQGTVSQFSFYQLISWRPFHELFEKKFNPESLSKHFY